ncbi:MAG: glycosyltransferase family 9 protein [Dissulfurispiraceae bacterium]|nr:glycosyltransferase family 9 protein [Dissulfurispiraceae bacterium]
MFKILLIKLGYSETLDPEIGRVSSLGDIVRTTPVLRALKDKYPESHITWLVDKDAEPLLAGNKFLDRVLVWDEFVPFQLMREKFDILINLEKIAGVCALTDMTDAWIKYGFRFDSIKGIYHAYEKGLTFIDYISEKNKTGRPKNYWQKVLIEMLGAEWKEQKYILGYKPKSEVKYDVGFNYLAGTKWPNKIMAISKWKELERKLMRAGYKISWQQGIGDLYEYMDWMHSCKLVISQDSLGIHLALALKKKVIGLFGPTDPNEIFFYNYGKGIYTKQQCSYKPCYKPKCAKGIDCMNGIDLDEILENVNELMEIQAKSKRSAKRLNING